MPELPEVENVRRGLEQGATGQVFAKVNLRTAKLRTPLKREIQNQLQGQTLKTVSRRAKFLVFETEDYWIVNHLGMTGSWRSLEENEKLKKHDHVVFGFKGGLTLVYNDPRKFGLLEVRKKNREMHPWLSGLGPEPLSQDFSPETLFAFTRSLKSSIKSVIMDQRKVVGVGNIYASEALFLAGIRPTKPAGRINQKEARAIVAAIQQVLRQAIEAGGSTIRDYRNANGKSGNFQNQFKVYGRADQPCFTCKSSIVSRTLAQRNTYWCPKCQH